MPLPKAITAYMTVQGILTDQGLLLIQSYYKNKGGAPYCIRNRYDLEILYPFLSKNTKHAIIFRNDAIAHVTPIIIQDKTFIILDSLGAYDETQQTIQLINKIVPDAKIITPSHQRQSDHFSCGTDALVTCKQALQIDIMDFYQSHSESHMPGNIAKYTQAVARLKDTSRRGHKPGLLEKYPALDQFLPNKDKQKQKYTSVWDYVTKHLHENQKWNKALDERREKHRTILKTMLAEKSDDELMAMMREAAGINLLKTNPQNLIPVFRNPKINFGPSPEILDLIGIRKVFKNRDGSTMEMIAHGNLKDPTFCHTALYRIRDQYALAEEKFLTGEKSMTFKNLAQLIYAEFYLKTEMIRNKMLAPDAPTSPIKSPTKAPALYKGLRAPAIGRMLMFPDITIPVEASTSSSDICAASTNTLNQLK